MPDLLTEITEIVTGLGMTGIGTLAEALAARPLVMRNVSDANWDNLDGALADGTHTAVFNGAWENGRAFFEEVVPVVVEVEVAVPRLRPAFW